MVEAFLLLVVIGAFKAGYVIGKKDQEIEAEEFRMEREENGLDTAR